MPCSDHDFSFRFVGTNGSDADFEVKPAEMTFRKTREEYDFCKAKLPYEVGQKMKPHTRYQDGQLSGLTEVKICYKGEAVHSMVFRPDYLDYGRQYAHIEFHDLHKALSDGIVDLQKSSIHLEEIYTTVLNKAGNRIVNEVVFSYPENQVRTVYGQKGLGANEGQRERRLEQDQTKRVVESSAAIDFDQISPELALRKLNKKFTLKTWFNASGQLVVGLPEATGIEHIAAPRDERVWRYKDPELNHGREPIYAAVVEGGWEDEPGIDFDVPGWFNEGGTADVIAHGFARRKDVDEGNTFSISSTGAKKDALPEIAKLALEEKMKNHKSGTVEIDPVLSGETVSNVIDLAPGDTIHIVPDDDYFDNPAATSGEVGDKPDRDVNICGDFINNEKYLVTEVEHNLTSGGGWNVFADVGMKPDVEISTGIRYFDPSSEEWLSEDDVFDGNWIE